MSWWWLIVFWAIAVTLTLLFFKGAKKGNQWEDDYE